LVAEEDNAMGLMRFLSKLFGRAADRDGSYVRAYAELRKRESVGAFNLSLDTFFDVMMYCLAVFAKPAPPLKTSDSTPARTTR
tara:strand:+ start:197 stop:445 length:249 start_codon:yes stop_codon:yes gene_type:complete